MARKLNFRQKAFIDAWDGNATRSARAAGYANPRRAGSRLLTNNDILSAIKSREESFRDKSAIATREDRQTFWSVVMQDEEQDMKNRLRAAELLGKSEADFVQKHQVEGDMDHYHHGEISDSLNDLLSRTAGVDADES